MGFLDGDNRRQRINYIILHRTIQQFKPTNLERLFCNMPHVEEISLGHLNTEQAVSMRSMFEGCTKLRELDLTTMDTHNVQDMSNMFVNCKSLEHVYMSPEFEFGYTEANREDVKQIFAGCNPKVQFHIMDYKRDERWVPHKYEVAKYSLSEMKKAIQAYLDANY